MVTEIQTSEKKTGYKWIVYALLTAFSYGCGNTIFGVYLSDYGLYGTSLTAPLGLIVSILHKLYYVNRDAKKSGKCFDSSNSNFINPPKL